MVGDLEFALFGRGGVASRRLRRAWAFAVAWLGLLLGLGPSGLRHGSFRLSRSLDRSGALAAACSSYFTKVNLTQECFDALILFLVTGLARAPLKTRTPVAAGFFF